MWGGGGGGGGVVGEWEGAGWEMQVGGQGWEVGGVGVGKRVGWGGVGWEWVLGIGYWEVGSGKDGNRVMGWMRRGWSDGAGGGAAVWIGKRCDSHPVL